MIEKILAETHSDGFREWLAALLMELCAVDTTPHADVDVMRRAEGACFNALERELGALSLPGARAERRPIDPAIAAHPAFTQLHFTKTPDLPAGLSPEETYRGRANLVFVAPGEGAAGGVAANAHLDIVAPFVPPRREGNVIYGRGACDDKGSVVAIVGALKVIDRVLATTQRRLRRPLVAMLVVEEETGGNGSLSLALDRELKRLYDTLIVMECTDNGLFPANRGAVWYQAHLALAGVPLFEMFAFVNEEMEKEGRAIRAESRHPLFPQRPVQTCHGIIGPIGEHPSRICGEVGFRVGFPRTPDADAEQLVRDCLDFAVEEYVGRYGDKTKVIDPRTGRPKVDHHYDLRRDGNDLVVSVHGSTGHMGSIFENDGAITKMATMVRALVFSRARLESLAGGVVSFELDGARYGDLLRLEGGQGFVPTHDIGEVMRRMARAAERGAEAYLRRIGRADRGEEAVRVTYDKLHNNAFDGDPDSPAMRNAVAAMAACGPRREGPIVGLTVSCDARLFAGEYPEMPVITSGPGRVAHAHADAEQLDLDELRAAVEFLALFLLRQTGTVR